MKEKDIFKSTATNLVKNSYDSGKYTNISNINPNSKELIPVVTLENLKEIFCDYYKWLDKDLPNGIYTRQQILAMIEIHLFQIMKLLRNEKGNL